jgi:hypothetical protein
MQLVHRRITFICMLLMAIPSVLYVIIKKKFKTNNTIKKIKT